MRLWTILGVVVMMQQEGMAQWTSTGSMQYARQWHSATLLNNGQVLVAGGKGTNGAFPAAAETYDPATATWGSGGSMVHPRIFHSATLLVNGRVFVAGGQYPAVVGVATAEIYDAASNQWSAAASMHHGRDSHSATLLPDGRVLVAGGEGPCGGGLVCYLASAEIYNPAANRWTVTGSLHVQRLGHQAVLLPNGTVLVTGGSNANQQYGIATSEVYDPATGVWTLTGSMSFPRSAFTMNLLSDGEVLAAGGGGSMNTGRMTAELYNWQTGVWTATADLNIARERQASALLASSAVLVTGGTGHCTSTCPTLASAESYDPVAGTWSLAGTMITRRWAHQATTLPSGLVLVEGGVPNEVFGYPPLASAELYTPSIQGVVLP